MSSFKTSKSKKRFFYQEGLTKALSDVMEYHISLQTFSEYDSIDLVSYIDMGPKTQKDKVVVL